MAVGPADTDHALWRSDTGVGGDGLIDRFDCAIVDLAVEN